MDKLTLKSGIEIAFVGPPLSAGPLPALFYFALSAQDSLCLDPFNQPVTYLLGVYPNTLKNGEFGKEAPQISCPARAAVFIDTPRALDEKFEAKPTPPKTNFSMGLGIPMRIFSLTLPGHENNLPPTQALAVWAKEIGRGHNIISTFVEKTRHALDALLEAGYLLEDKIAVSGLSRGAFIATHAAAKIPEFKTLLGFAPLTQIAFAKEFEEIQELPLVQALSLEHLASALTSCSIRYYIGNVDTRVSTRRCFDFIEKVSQTAYDKRIRSPSVELIISPSIGQHGHGTPTAIFHQGAQWVAERLGVIDAL